MTKLNNKHVSAWLDEQGSLNILDIKDISENGLFLVLYPVWFPFSITLSPHIVQKIVHWGIKNHYLELNGTLTVPKTMERKRHYVSAKEKDVT